MWIFYWSWLCPQVLQTFSPFFFSLVSVDELRSRLGVRREITSLSCKRLLVINLSTKQVFREQTRSSIDNIIIIWFIIFMDNFLVHAHLLPKEYLVGWLEHIVEVHWFFILLNVSVKALEGLFLFLFVILFWLYSKNRIAFISILAHLFLKWLEIVFIFFAFKYLFNFVLNVFTLPKERLQLILTQLLLIWFFFLILILIILFFLVILWCVFSGPSFILNVYFFFDRWVFERTS